ncbi:MAG: type I secretion system permease/ATPase [Magnetococcales bacterium]|nr:type I secretion system permease/ATPase [Magnetococcales bacterium]
MSDSSTPQEEWVTPKAKLSSAEDPLLACLEKLTKHWHKPCSAQSLRSGLPLEDGRLTPELLVRAAEDRAGLNAQIVKRPLPRIPSLVFPVILLLSGRQACILSAVEKGGDSVRVWLPDAATGEQVMPVAELQEAYTGFAIFVRPMFKLDGRSSEGYRDYVPKSWFWGTLGKFWRIYGEVGLSTILINLFTLASPLFVMNVYDRVVPNNTLDTLWVMAIGVSLVFVFDFIMRSLRGYLLDVAGKKADVLMANMIFRHVVNVRMELQPTSTGVLAKNIQEFESLRDFFTSATITGVIDLPFSLVFIYVIYLLAGPLYIVPLVVYPLVIMVSLLLQWPLSRAVKKSSKQASQKNAVLVETIFGMEAVKALGAEGVVQRKWEQCVGASAESSLLSRSISSLAVNFSAFAQQMTTVATIIYGVHLISEGLTTMGALFACSILSGRALAPLGKVAGTLVKFQQSAASLKSLNEIMSLEEERSSEKQFLHRPVTKGGIAFQDLSYSYPDSQTQSLKNISFSVKPGEKVAIIGRIGSGKTTILKIILGLYQPVQGAVLLDGTDLRQIDPADIRRNVGYAPQDPILFFGSIRDNIAYGSPDADDTMVLRAAEAAGVPEFTNTHPQGFDMTVGEQGRGLSGGQRQIVAVARSFLLDPKILLLDEPTSDMDRNTEERFKKRLGQHLRDKTLILVTHKTSMLSLVDRIIIVDEGSVIADGPKDKVLQMVKAGKITIPAPSAKIDDKSAAELLSAPEDSLSLTPDAANSEDKSRVTGLRSDAEFMTETTAASWKSANPVARTLLLMIILFFTSCVVWAKFAILEEVAVGLGKVIPSSQVQLVQSLEGGMISLIAVQEGESVKKGQILLKIDDTQSKATFQENRQKILSLKLRINRLEAEAFKKKFVPPESLRINVPALVSNEEKIYKSRKQELMATINILNKRVFQKKQELKELESELRQISKQLNLVKRELELSIPVVAQGLMSEVELLRLKREVADLTGRRDAALLAIPRIRSTLSEARQQAKEPKMNFQTLVLEELNEKRVELAQISETITAMKDRVTRTAIRSPVSGTVIRVQVSTLGQVVQSGMDLVEIMPLEDTLLVEARIRPEDIAFLSPGQKTMVKFTAYDFSIYGGLPGQLEHISADTIMDEKGEHYYEIRVRTKKKQLGNINNPLPIIPGMVASVDIITGKKSVLDYLLKPIIKAKGSAMRER